MPPLSFVYLALLGLLILKKYPRLGKVLSVFSLVMVLFLSTPFVSHFLTNEAQFTEVVKNVDSTVQAIVILGGGVYQNAPEYDGASNLGTSSLERIKYGAYLARKSKLPILVSGGDPYNAGVNEADVMKNVLEKEFFQPVMWAESRSKDTFENAKYSYQMLAKQNILKIYLVTHASHMIRAMSLFQNSGFVVVPAPIMIERREEPKSFFNFLPQMKYFNKSAAALHERLGIFWYYIKSSI